MGTRKRHPVGTDRFTRWVNRSVPTGCDRLVSTRLLERQHRARDRTGNQGPIT
ncbi:hypothetical protein FTUN_0187 [Frigoriglobus tundricola]|uniref:Uncharacterized protein n=1 Tax=Frigoriglobus tundricola TaxID=2774151 RepID=A0A6M5YHA2_9BACT|nr:hypothetical protein FTUN_0187 [Frigoriglobus tundricola]